MEKICRNCKHGQPKDKGFVKKSLEAQSKMNTEKAKVIGKGKAFRMIAIGKVIALPEYEEHRKAHGALSLTQKKTDEDGNYIVCSNLDHIQKEDAKVRRKTAPKDMIVHKYYFECDHFEKVSE